MRIKDVHVQNFRCIKDQVLPCEQLTTLIGPNSSGKSSFLRALDMFYTSNAKYTEEDFYNKDASQEIRIKITFTDLTIEEMKNFQKYVESGDLTVEKVMSWPPGKTSQKYYGNHLQNPDFDSFRSAGGTSLRAEYSRLHENGYPDFPPYTNKDDAEGILQEWEESHPNKCVQVRDDGQFFGFKEVGRAHLERCTRFILVPAVRDASEDAMEGRGAPLTEIMDVVVRSVLSQRNDLVELQETTREQYKRILDPDSLSELQRLQQDLSATLQVYIPNVGVQLEWETVDVFDIPMPRANVRLIEDKYPSSVERTGHGLQRAFIMTMLQYLALAQSRTSEDIEPSSGMLSLIIGIEEPELYQHPNRQRHLSKVLLRLVDEGIRGVAKSTQIIYTTHSPLFVDMGRFGSVRRLCKLQGESDTSSMPKQTRVFHTTLDEVAKAIEKIDEKPEGTYTGATLEPRLWTLMTPWMNEGFFADVAVLVEGEEDRAAILGMATAMGYDLESIGISVIPCMGKRNLDRPTVIFSKLGIPVYGIWDSDYEGNNSKPEENHRLLRLFDQSCKEDWPEKVTDHFACFKYSLNRTLSAEIGYDLFRNILDSLCKKYNIERIKNAKKNPLIVQKTIIRAQEKRKSSKTLEDIVSKIISLKQGTDLVE
ncbi:MAG: ATP-dependent endonuclease [Theionarchaea archaeon]|nr:ATP-dependent endonuclease [Theionarchaea archaeon]